MGIFDRFPYSSTHEMNLDFMLGKATEIAESLQEIDTHKEQAEQAATNAAQSAQNAAQAAQAAAGSQTAAGTSASQAAQHKADAEDAADRAEAASNLADEAVEQAQTAAQNASTSATAAGTAADGAIASAAAAETRINNLAASLPEDFTELNNEVTGLKSAINTISVKSKNLMPIAGHTVSFSDIDASYSDGVISISGTATADGGRLNKLTDNFTLPAGTYYISALNSTGTTGAQVAIQNTSNQVLVLLNNSRTTLTLQSSTALFLGVSVTNGQTYNYTVEIQIEEDEYTVWTAPSYMTALDATARGKVADFYGLFGEYASPEIVFDGNSYINYTSGATGSLSGNSASGYIPVSTGENISMSGYTSSAWSDVRGIAFYDSDKVYLSGLQLDGATKNFIVPPMAAYMRITVETAYTGTYTLKCTFGNMIADCGKLISGVQGQPTQPSIAMFEKVGFCGDSYVKGQLYNSSGVIGDFPNLAWGSVIGRLCGIDAEIYASSGADTNTWQSRSDCLPALLAEQNPCGLYIFCMGINDSTYVTLGSMEDITSHSSYADYPNTFYGNYGKIIEQILAYSHDSKIILMTPFHPSYNVRYVKPLTEISEHYSIAMIDTTKSSLCNTAFANALIGGHPTSVQQGQMADNIIALVADCISANVDYFADYHGV